MTIPEPSGRTDADDDLEVVDGEWVDDEGAPASAPPVEEAAPAASPARTRVRPVASARTALPAVAQAAVVAVGGFAVGAVTVAVARRAASRRLATRRGNRVHGLPIVGSRSFLVDVHLIDRRD